MVVLFVVIFVGHFLFITISQIDFRFVITFAMLIKKYNSFGNVRRIVTLSFKNSERPLSFHGSLKVSSTRSYVGTAMPMLIILNFVAIGIDEFSSN